MTTIATILTEGFADWETAILNSVARYTGQKTVFVTPGGAPVTSTGGFKVTPDLALEDLDLDTIDALVVSGGTIWQSEAAPDVSTPIQSARAKGKVVAGICDGTGYGGAARYRDVPYAVRDGKIVTATATAPVGFMSEVFAALGLADDNLAYYVGMHAAEHAGRTA
jgi:putative intracellular protease/amidase